MTRKGFTTQLVHCDRLSQHEHGAIHAPIHHSVPYGYDDIHDLVDVFQGKQAGHAYARQSTPTTDSLSHKVTQLEQGHASLVFGTGMAAICATFLTLLKQGDHLICSRFIFGNTSSVMATLRGYGIEVTLVDSTDVANVEAAYQANTKMVFVETIANPVTQVAALAEIGTWCQQKGLLYVVDNTMTSPYLFQPVKVQASLVVNSLSKYVGGHGNALGGAVTDTGLFDWTQYDNIFAGYQKGDPKMWGLSQIKKKGLRDMGGSLSGESAHLLSAGSDTLALRMQRQCGNAQALANMLQQHPKVSQVYYPGLSSHPQHQRAAELFADFGAILSFDLAPGHDCCALLNHLQWVIGATHLGDNRSLALPVAQTIYYEMGLEARQQMGISENMIRCSIGIEDSDDLLADFEQALAKV